MEFKFRCECGAVEGVASSQHGRGIRAICLCDDCQAYAHYLGKAREILDENGGSSIYPVMPADLQITKGFEQIRGVRLGPKGMYRWYAGCCKSPIGNSPSAPKMPYVGMVSTVLERTNDLAALEKAFGPIQERIMGRFGIGQPKPGTHEKASMRFLLKVIPFALWGFVRKHYQPSPFFDEQLQAKPPVSVLAKAERDALRPFCGPHPTQGPFAQNSRG